MALPLHEHLGQDGFRLRGTELARIDAFSDVVFGFALTLLVVSLEVPRTFEELHQSLHSFLPFSLSFLFLMMVWYAHYNFFRRMGTHDFGTIAINGTLLFVVLFYVYPLKFLFTFVTSWLISGSTASLQSNEQLAELMMLYGIGFAAVYLLLAALYANALRQRKELQLSPLELYLTRTYIIQSAGVGLIGLLASALAILAPPELSGFTGWTYLLIAFFRPIYGRISRRGAARFA